MNKKYLVVGVMVAVLAVAFCAYLVNEKFGTKPTDSTVVATSTIGLKDEVEEIIAYDTATEKRELSLDGWLLYSGTEAGLNNEVWFRYPYDWHSIDAVGGGGGAQSGFEDVVYKKQVAHLNVHSYGYLSSEYDKEFATIIKKEPVVIGGWSGEIVYRTVAKPDEIERKEWWLILPQVGEEKEFSETFEFDGFSYSCVDIPCPTTTSYEIYMEDAYLNSEAVFRQLVESVRFAD